jgi:hypothetical protein
MAKIRLADFLNDKHEAQKKKNKELQTKIHKCFRSGFSREEIFVRLCRTLPGISVNEAAECFERIEKGVDIAYKFDETHKDLFMMILTEIEKMRSAIIECQEPLYEDVTFLNSRYAISTSMDDLIQSHMYLLDNFYGQRR